MKTRDTVCAVCQKVIPAGTGCYRRGMLFVHIECAEESEKRPPRRPSK